MYFGPCPGRTPHRVKPGGYRDHGVYDLRPLPPFWQTVSSLTRWQSFVWWLKITLNTAEVQETRKVVWAEIEARFPRDDY